MLVLCFLAVQLNFAPLPAGIHQFAERPVNLTFCLDCICCTDLFNADSLVPNVPNVPNHLPGKWQTNTDVYQSNEKLTHQIFFCLIFLIDLLLNHATKWLMWNCCVKSILPQMFYPSNSSDRHILKSTRQIRKLSVFDR